MNVLNTALILIIGCTLYACSSEAPKTVISEDKTADALIEAAYRNHGGKRYETANYSFKFRDRYYTFKNEGEKYIYTRKFTKKGHAVQDIYENGELTRYVDGEEWEISEEKQKKFGSALNSVIYFATLPHKLQDPAVIKSYIGQNEINKIVYEVVQVRFFEDGGGEDHQDEYLYWINPNTFKIDYFAYNYQVDGGGVRYRIAYNPRVVNGIIFQDYINLAARPNTPLTELPRMHEAGELEEVSRIELTEIVDLNDPNSQKES